MEPINACERKNEGLFNTFISSIDSAIVRNARLNNKQIRLRQCKVKEKGNGLPIPFLVLRADIEDTGYIKAPANGSIAP